MSLRKSIRWRIQIWHAALLLFMCLGFGVTAYRLEKSNALSRIDQDLDIRLNTLVTSVNRRGGPPGRRPPPRAEDGLMADDPSRDGRPPRRRPPRDGDPGGPPEEGWNPGRPPGEDGDEEDGRPPRDRRRLLSDLGSPEVTALFDQQTPGSFYYQIWDRSQTLLAKTGNAPADISLPVTKSEGGKNKAIRVRGGLRESYVFTPPGECFLVGLPLRGMEQDSREFAWKIAGIGAAVLTFGLAVGWWIASRALRPISEISLAASRIAAGNLHERIRTGETESELGRLASVLDDTFQRLNTAFDEQARFTSDAAHELRTPLAIILARSQLALSKERGIEDYRETIEISQRAAKRMHALVESLLQLAVLDGSGRDLHPESCDLREIVADQISLMGSMAAEKDIAVITSLSPAKCIANVGHIGQIVINLLTNAVKFCPPGSEIRIRTCSSGDSAMMVVTDNGPGIAEKHLPFLFERFYRVESSRNRDTGGAGLGLAICQRLAEAHGGSLIVQSTEGQGASFTLTLPVDGART